MNVFDKCMYRFYEKIKAEAERLKADSAFPDQFNNLIELIDHIPGFYEEREKLILNAMPAWHKYDGVLKQPDERKYRIAEDVTDELVLYNMEEKESIPIFQLLFLLSHKE